MKQKSVLEDVIELLEANRGKKEFEISGVEKNWAIFCLNFLINVNSFVEMYNDREFPSQTKLVPVNKDNGQNAFRVIFPNQPDTDELISAIMVMHDIIKEDFRESTVSIGDEQIDCFTTCFEEEIINQYVLNQLFILSLAHNVDKPFAYKLGGDEDNIVVGMEAQSFNKIKEIESQHFIERDDDTTPGNEVVNVEEILSRIAEKYGITRYGAPPRPTLPFPN